MKPLKFWILLFPFVISSFRTSAEDSRNITTDSTKVIEKVYLHADRDAYLPGENIWFKAFLIDAYSNMLTNNSSNLYVDLLSPEGVPVLTRVIRLAGGLGKGDFALSDSLKPGIYNLRAYTNYMRNFGEQLFFNKNILIINPSDRGAQQNNNETISDNDFDLDFFPEGGSLVENVPSSIAFRASDHKGQGINIEGEVYASSGEFITAFKTSLNGMGLFYLKPFPRAGYYVLAHHGNSTPLRIDLPKAFQTGVVIHALQHEEGRLRLSFRTNDTTFAINDGAEYHLLLTRHEETFKEFSFVMETPNSSINIPTDDIPDGIYCTTLYNSKYIPVCERLIFLNNNSNTNLKIGLKKEIFQKRDSIEVSISFDENRVNNDITYLSFSAAEEAFSGNFSPFPTTISSWFLLESDVKGKVEDPSHYFDPSNDQRFEQLNLLLLTQGWRDFKWKYNTLRYEPEHGFYVSGRVRKKFANVPILNSNVTVGIFGEGKPLIATMSVDSAGLFRSENFEFTGRGKMIASITGQKDELRGWILIDSTKDVPVVRKQLINQEELKNKKKGRNSELLASEEMPRTINYHKFTQSANYKNSIKNKYHLTDTINPGEVNIVATRSDWTETAESRGRHYLKATPDQSLVIYPDFPDKGDVYTLVNNRFVSLYKLPWGLNFRMQYPIYLVDGVEAEEDFVKSLRVSDIERVDVLQPVTYSAIYGWNRMVQRNDSIYAQADGAISIILKSQDVLRKKSLHSGSMTFRGYDEPRVFYSPRHSVSLESDYKPDLRTTVFWDPEIKLQKDSTLTLKYFNTDNPAKIRITVEGISSSGIPVTGIKSYEVK